jgi:hypothetical protein
MAEFDTDAWLERIRNSPEAKKRRAAREKLLATETPEEKVIREAEEAEREARYLALSEEWAKEYYFPVRNHGGHALPRSGYLGYPKNEDGSLVYNADGTCAGPQYSDIVTGMDLNMRDHRKCYYCDEVVETHITRAGNLAVNTRCEYADGVPLKFQLAVPSGFMVVGNDFRQMGDWLHPNDSFEDETHKGLMPRMGDGAQNTVNTSHWYADRGLAHAYVGNSCPHLYRTGDDTYTMSSGGWDRVTDEDIEPDGESIAYVCTDLWWYSICDYDEWIKRGGSDKFDSYTTKVAVTPGVYEFDHHITEAGFDRDGPGVTHFTDIYLVEKY